MLESYRLGASLYVPAMHTKLLQALRGDLFQDVRSLIACTEDAVAEVDLPRALAKIKSILPALPSRAAGPLRFIRPRNADVLAQLLDMRDIDRIHGFVIPKADIESLPAYERHLAGSDFLVMPTLETSTVFDLMGQRDLRQYLESSVIRPQILALRIGGNDLLRILAMRRTRGTTSYETPIGLVIQHLVLTFRPYGFQLTAPVYDFIDDPETLVRETQADLAMGLIGKTAIHPDQIAVIESAFKVCEDDLNAAREILTANSAVFKFNGAMMEVAVHTRWAQSILARFSPETFT
jgi:citrate lyase beta subunit